MGLVTDFSGQYQKKNTRGMYLTGVRAFLVFTYAADRKAALQLHVLDDLADRYILDKRDHTRDVLAFAATFSSSPPKTARTYLTAVKEFLLFCDIELSQMDQRKLRKRMPRGGTATVEKILDAAMVRVILLHCNLMMRALVLLLVSSGLRIGEALSLDVNDIRFEGGIGHIAVRGMDLNGGGAKGGISRHTFCSSEAVDAIKEWLKKRDEYLDAAVARGQGIGQFKVRDDTRLFPVAYSTVSDMWLRVMTAAGLVSRDRVTGRLQVHIHMTRKFFSSQMRLAVPVDIVQVLAGHRGYLTDEYRRYTPDQIREFYLKGEPYVTIAMTDEIRELKTTTEKRMQTQAEIMEVLVRRNMALETRVGDLENLMRNIERTSVMLERE